jgi:hypothetical protein
MFMKKKSFSSIIALLLKLLKSSQILQPGENAIHQEQLSINLQSSLKKQSVYSPVSNATVRM